MEGHRQFDVRIDEGPSVSGPSDVRSRSRKIAILGFGKTVKECPWRDESWELWAMNGFWRAALPDYGIDVPESRYSAWFDTHTIEFTREYGKAAGFGDAQERWLEQPHPFPVFMLGEDPKFPSVVRYPVEEVIAKAGRDYFTSSVAYMIALAYCQDDVAEVGLYGIDLVHDTEYGYQRPCAEYWTARLEGLGVKVTLPKASAMLKAPGGRYGSEREDHTAKLILTELLKQRRVLEKTIDELRGQEKEVWGRLHTNDGALQAVNAMIDAVELRMRGGLIGPTQIVGANAEPKKEGGQQS